MTVRAPGQVVAHPLQRLGADEIRQAKALLAGRGLVGEHTRFAYLGLEEPPKAEVLAFREAVDSAAELDTARDGQPPIMLEDLVAVDEIVKADPGWRAATERRGVTDLDLVRPSRCRPGRSGSRARRAGGCCGSCPSSSTTPRTIPGPTRWTAWSPTST